MRAAFLPVILSLLTVEAGLEHQMLLLEPQIAAILFWIHPGTCRSGSGTH